MASGRADFATSGSTTTITTSDVAVINYDRFNIRAGETVNFVQPGVDSRVLNRVVGSTDRSMIFGNLLANGQVYVVNPSGVIFGEDSIVNASHFYAVGGNITDKDFLSGELMFRDLRGTVTNLGSISAERVALLGKIIENKGSIVAPDGLVTLAAGEEVYLGERDGNVFVNISNASDVPGAAVENSGSIDAEGGFVGIYAGDHYSLAIQQSGSLVGQEVRLEGGDEGLVEISGDISTGNDPGKIGVYADHFLISGDLATAPGGEFVYDPVTLTVVAGAPGVDEVQGVDHRNEPDCWNQCNSGRG